MDFIQTIIISIVEGLTEFLPVSSTGHMIIAENLLGVDIQDKFVNAFTVIIQFGAILSVICLYWKRFFYPEAVKTGEKTYLKAMFDFYARLVVGIVPAVVLGLSLIHISSTDSTLDSTISLIRLPINIKVVSSGLSTTASLLVVWWLSAS